MSSAVPPRLPTLLQKKLEEAVNEENEVIGLPKFGSDPDTGKFIAIRDITTKDGTLIRQEYLRGNKWKPLKKEVFA